MSAALLKLRWFVLYLVSRAGLLLPRRIVPPRLAYAVAVRVADLCFVLFRGPRRKLIANLARVVGDEGLAREAARGAFRQYAKYIIDLFQLPALGPAAIRARTDFDGWAELNAVAAEGRGTIFATLHFGQQETGAAFLAAHGYKVNVIARTLEFGPIDSLIHGFRRAMGMNVIPAERGRLSTFRCLARNEVLGMLVDQVDPGDGVPVTFLGAKAEMSPAPAKIALRTGARVVPTVVVRGERDDRRFLPIVSTSLRFEPTGDEEADVQAFTQLISSSFEDLVRRYPDQWFAFRPVWTEESKRKEGIDWNDRLNHYALEFANAAFGQLPKPAAYAVARFVGDLAFRLRKGIRADVEDNMRHVLGDDAPQALVSTHAREVFRNVCRYYADLLRIPRTKPEDLMSKEMTLAGFPRVQEAMAGGRGCVIATAHFGNPEMAPQIGALLGLDVLVLSEPLNPPAFSELVHRLRESQGARYEEVGFKSIGRALAHLRHGGTLALTCDRDIQDAGTAMMFFGEETRIPLGAAEMAARTGAVMVPAYCKRAGMGYELLFHEPLDLVDTGRPKQDAIETTKKMLRLIEDWIRSDPGQWMVLERIWPEKPAAADAREKAVASATMPPSGER